MTLYCAAKTAASRQQSRAAQRGARPSCMPGPRPIKRCGPACSTSGTLVACSTGCGCGWCAAGCSRSGQAVRGLPPRAEVRSWACPSICLPGRVMDHRLRPSLRSAASTDHRGRGGSLPGAGPADCTRCDAALLPGADHRAQGEAGGNRQLHVQLRCWAAADIDAATAGQPAGLAGSPPNCGDGFMAAGRLSLV